MAEVRSKRSINAMVTLEVTRIENSWQWDWCLFDENRNPLAASRVHICSDDWRTLSLINMEEFLWQHSTPDTPDEDDERLLIDLGEWIGGEIIGPAIASRLISDWSGNTLVRVIVPERAEHLLTFPFELAIQGGRKLTDSGVSFIIEPLSTPCSAKLSGNTLRILFLFSLPSDGDTLDLRRERKALQSTLQSLARSAEMPLECRFLQYGVTLTAFEAAVGEAGGWDIIHFSGHGSPGAIYLETADGNAEQVLSGNLAKVLLPTRDRLKLVVLSACSSAATTLNRMMSLFGRDDNTSADAEAKSESSREFSRPREYAPNVANALAQSLGCAVLAMRYSVEDDFAISLSEKLYAALLVQRMTLPGALRSALKAAGGNARSAASPVLFGQSTAKFQIDIPTGHFADQETLLAHFPAQAQHFVGRVSAMTCASRLLSKDPGSSGVLIHGMAGLGKTSCALELAYNFNSSRTFSHYVWFDCTAFRGSVNLAFLGFARLLGLHIPELPSLLMMEDPGLVEDWVERVVAKLAVASSLIVVDNVETLLDSQGRWIDQRWLWFVTALLRANGGSRLLITSQHVPQDWTPAGATVSIYSLTRDECLLLLNHLPNLGHLLYVERKKFSGLSGLDLVHRALDVIQGHPKLLNMAEAMAAQPSVLADQVNSLRSGKYKIDSSTDDFLTGNYELNTKESLTLAITMWTNRAIASLDGSAQAFFRLTCSVEATERRTDVLKHVWERSLREVLGGSRRSTAIEMIQSIVGTGLAERVRLPGATGIFSLIVHPLVVGVGMSDLGNEVRQKVDASLAALLVSRLRQAVALLGRSPDAGRVLVEAGLSAFRYLYRLESWIDALIALQHAIRNDHTQPTATAILPLAEQLVKATSATSFGLETRGFHAAVLWRAGFRGQAISLYRRVIEEAASQRLFWVAEIASSNLTKCLVSAASLNEALASANQTVRLGKLASDSVITEMVNTVAVLDVENHLGDWERILEKLPYLRLQFDSLPHPKTEWEQLINFPALKREILDLGRRAAIGLKNWQLALELNKEIWTISRATGAQAFELESIRFNDHIPLWKGKHLDEARHLLLDCRREFEKHSAVNELGLTFSALSSVEADAGDFAEAQRYERSALRYKYQSTSPAMIAVSHHNFARRLHDPGQFEVRMAHWLAAIFISMLVQSAETSDAMRDLVADVCFFGSHFIEDLDLARLASKVEEVPGVSFAQLIVSLSPDQIKNEQSLRDLILHVRRLAE